jgi:hypothetical protein
MAKVDVTVDIDLDMFDDDEIYNEADKRGLFVRDGGIVDACAFVAEQLYMLSPDKRDAVLEAMRECHYNQIGQLLD